MKTGLTQKSPLSPNYILYSKNDPAPRQGFGMERLFYSVQERLLLVNTCSPFIGAGECEAEDTAFRVPLQHF